MLIQFHCSTCDTLLQIPEDVRERKILCPNCNHITEPGPPEKTPPGHESFEAAKEPWSYRDYVESDNPFEAPGDLDKEETASDIIPGNMEPGKLRFGEVTSLTRKVFFRNFVTYLVIGFLCSLWILPFVILILLEEIDPNYEFPEFLVELEALITIFLSLLGILFFASLVSCSLALVKNERVNLAVIAAGMRRFFGFLGYSILLWVLLYVPFFLLIAGVFIFVLFIAMTTAFSDNFELVIVILIYGLIFGAGTLWQLFVLFRFGWGYFALIDRKTSMVKATHVSVTISRGNLRVAIVLVLFHALVSAIFCVITVGLGLLIAIPYNLCLATVCYLVMAGRPDSSTARQKIPVEW